MKTKILTLALAFLLGLPGALFSQERNLLSGSFNEAFLRENIVPANDYKPLPPCGDPAWNVIPQNQRQAIINTAEKYLGYDYPLLKATTYLDFVRNGNRTRYQAVYSARRDAIVALLMGEILENKGRFIDDIVNGIWTISEETSWTIPAHIGEQKRGNGLPDKNDPVVALFSAETASLMAAVDYFVGDRLDKVDPLIRERLESEVRDRILDPLLQRNDYWWMGLSGRIPNNWDPWIVSNWLNAILVLEKDPQRRADGLHKALVVLDQFLNPYPADGGCDEGPGYWNHAGASLFDCLYQLHTASNGKIDIYDNPLIVNIGDYIWKVYIDKYWFVNFADASPRLHPNPFLMYRFGEATGSGNLKGFAKMMFEKQVNRENEPEHDYGYYGLMIRTLPGFFALPDLKNAAEDFDFGSVQILPDLQVFAAREIPGTTDGLYLAAKGGNNNESHNHNDVGNFIVYLDGNPLLIDAGVGTYTAKTFSSHRYEIWTMQSAYHNLPDFNGVMQKDGAKYRAQNVKFSERRSAPSMTLDISGAYPAEAGVSEAWRTIELDRSHHRIDLTDAITFSENKNTATLHFMAWQKPVIKDGRVIFTDHDSGKEIAELTFPKSLSPAIEELTLEDHHLSRTWGDHLYRINLAGGTHGNKVMWKCHVTRLKD